jgi:microcystin-dependent protein
MSIAENDALFVLLGTTYGGDGQETFGLPDLQGRMPIHMGQGQGISQNYQIGEKAGVESVTITAQTTPIHTHTLVGSTANATDPNPGGNILASSTVLKPYLVDFPNNNLAASSISIVGGSQPHDNMMPFLAVSFIISLYGIFPHQ